MREATFKFLIKNQHFSTIFDTWACPLSYKFFIVIFVLFLCFRMLIYFGLVGLDEHHQYMLIQSCNLHGFMAFMMGIWAWIWQGLGGMGLDLAQVWQMLSNNIECL